MEAVTLLNEAQEKLQSANSIVASCRDDEEESYENLPESIQDGEKGDAMMENVGALDDVVSELESVYDSIEEQIDAIQEVVD